MSRSEDRRRAVQGATLYALTLWRPWTDAIFAWPGKHAKRIENRTWYRASMVGRHFAIHAGARYDRDGAAMVAELAEGVAEQRPEFTWRVPSAAESPQGIVGVAKLCGVIDADATGEPRLIAGERPASGFVWAEWWMGGIGWLLDDVTAIEPVPCKGAQGLWTVPPDVADEVRRRWRAARRVAA